MSTVLSANIQGGILTRKRNSNLNNKILDVHPEVCILSECRDTYQPPEGYRIVGNLTISSMRRNYDRSNTDAVAILVRNDVEVESCHPLQYTEGDLIDVFGQSLSFGRFLIVGVHLHPYSPHIRIQELEILDAYIKEQKFHHPRILIVGDWNIALSHAPCATALSRWSHRVKECIDPEQKAELLTFTHTNHLSLHNFGYTFPVGPIRKGFIYRAMSQCMPKWACLDFVAHSYSIRSRGRMIDGSKWSDHDAIAISLY